MSQLSNPGKLARATWAPGSRGPGFGHGSSSTLVREGSLTLVRTGRLRTDTLQHGKETSLSSTATLANVKAERTLQRYAAVQQELHARSGNVQSTVVDNSGSQLEHRAEAFEEAANHCFDRIDTLTKSIRLEHLSDSPEARAEKEAAKEREEARKRREVELRRARKREQAARDPHRKVALRLENTRRFKQDEVDKMDVPMLRMSVNGRSGPEQETLVDVRKIRTRCQLIDEGPSVHTLLDLQRHRERFGRPNATMSPTMTVSMSEPTMTASKSEPTGHHEAPRRLLENTRRLSQLPSDQMRREARQVLREGKFLDSVLKKLTTMRSEPTEAMLRNLSLQERHCLALAKVRGLSANQPTSPGSPKSPAAPSSRNTTEIVRRTRVTMRQRTTDVDDLLEPLTKQRSILDSAASQRAQRHWRILRCAASLIFLSVLVRSKKRSIIIVKSVLKNLGEWSRMQRSIRTLIKNVTSLQRGGRQFLASKRKRCDAIEKDWQRIENRLLPIIIMQFAQQALVEKMDDEVKDAMKHDKNIYRLQSVKSKVEHDELNKLMMSTVGSLEWRRYRIPCKDRKEVVSRYYMVLLKKRVKNRQNLYGTLQHIVRNQREMHIFFSQFGAESASAKLGLESLTLPAAAADHVRLDFWHLSEDTILDLIALAAQRLRGQEPWRDHPANRDVPGNIMFRPAIHAACSNSSKENAPIRVDILRMLGEKTDRPQAGPRSRPNGSPQKAKHKTEQKSQADTLDVDDVLGGLTPRHLKEFSRQHAGRLETPASRSGRRSSGQYRRPPSQHLLSGLSG